MANITATRAPVVMASMYIARVDVSTVDCADSAKFVVLVVFTDAVVLLPLIATEI